MTVNINSWACIGDEDHIGVLASGDNRCAPADYLKIVPTENNNRIIGFDAPEGPEMCRWIMEAANADPTQTMDVLLIAGSPAASPPQIVMPPGYSKMRLKPGFTARLYYETGVGWCILLPGTLEA